LSNDRHGIPMLVIPFGKRDNFSPSKIKSKSIYPSTIINYSIPNQNFVTLKVFDVLGREITTLINKEQSQGNYEVEFYATQFSSGVYYYQLRVGNFIQSKKMLLLK